MKARKIYAMFFALLISAGSIGFFIIDHYCKLCHIEKLEFSVLNGSEHEHHHHACTHAIGECNQCACETSDDSESCSSYYFTVPVVQTIVYDKITPGVIDLLPLLSLYFGETGLSDKGRIAEYNNNKRLHLPPLLGLLNQSDPENVMSFRL